MINVQDFSLRIGARELVNHVSFRIDKGSDLSMMRAAGFGVAMGNAPENVRRRAPMVIGKNDEEGLLKRLKEIFKD